MTNDCKKSFVLYADYKRHLDLIDDANEYRALFDSVFEYCLTGYEPENLKGMAAMAFSFIKADIDRNCAKYESVKDKRRASGRKGGIAKAANNSDDSQILANVASASFANDCLANVASSSDANFCLANVAVNDNVNGNVNGNVNENGTDNGIKKEILSPKGDCRQRADDCPHDEIIALYHEMLPELPRVREWNKKRKAYLNARWREDKKRQNLDYWKLFFELVSECDFLMGRTKTPFKANLEWLVRESNFLKVRERFYLNDRQ